jgi:DNA polymerase-3 subunit delta
VRASTCFGLTDAILNGEAAHALRMLEGLRGEGVEPPVILWALSRELRVLANLALQYSQGVPLDKAFSQARPPIWDKRKPLMSKALQRYSAQRWGSCCWTLNISTRKSRARPKARYGAA